MSDEAKAATKSDLKRSRRRARKCNRMVRRGDRSTLRGWLYGKAYRATMRLAHRYNWHHARVIGPVAPASEDGRDWLRRCDWCGFTMRFNPHPESPKVSREGMR